MTYADQNPSKGPDGLQRDLVRGLHLQQPWVEKLKQVLQAKKNPNPAQQPRTPSSARSSKRPSKGRDRAATATSSQTNPPNSSTVNPSIPGAGPPSSIRSAPLPLPQQP